jgi:hypothetical protein
MKNSLTGFKKNLMIFLIQNLILNKDEDELI